MADWLDERQVDLVVLAGYMELLSAEFVRRFSRRLVNVHPSLLPAFPGLHAIEQAIEHGVRVMGVTVHFVDEGVDTGPIIAQEAFEVDPYPLDVDAIEERVHAIEHELLPRAIRLIAAGAVSVDPDAPRRVIIEQGERRGDE
jgi:phosphoribosylglycinamide formyltransferase-1